MSKAKKKSSIPMIQELFDQLYAMDNYIMTSPGPPSDIELELMAQQLRVTISSLVEITEKISTAYEILRSEKALD